MPNRKGVTMAAATSQLDRVAVKPARSRLPVASTEGDRSVRPDGRQLRVCDGHGSRYPRGELP